MPDICLMFEAHQPLRLNHNFNSDLSGLPSVNKKDLIDLYFDQKLNRHIFERVARKCYFPANNIILEQIDNFKGGKKQFKVAYGVSGVLIEQSERWNEDLIESFKQLAETGCVEFLAQPYYHSLAGLYGTNRIEFVEQIKMHHQLVKDLFNYEPSVVENTECLYNNAIAKNVEGLGYKATVTEGVERILNWRSPNYVYKAKDTSLRVLLRNYRLSDDIGFRFSSRWWEEWPLTAEKYASWLAAAQGQTIVLFIDYETLGEHHWSESGIYDFLKWLPGEVIKWDNLNWRTPSEVIQRHTPVGEIDVQDLNTVSWADLERDPSAWIDNPMQILSFESLKRVEQPVKATGDEDLITLWRYLQMSDHLYYMSIKGGGPGDVHNYFNPSGNPIEAFSVFSRVLSDLEARVQLELEKPELAAKRMLRQIPVGRGFIFFYKLGQPTDWTVHSLDDFYSALEDVDLRSIKFHLKRGDFERWLRQVVGDEKLADELVGVSKKKLKGRKLRKSVLDLVKVRIRELKEMSV